MSTNSVLPRLARVSRTSRLVLVIAFLFALLAAPRVGRAQTTHYSFTKIADTVSAPSAGLENIYCVGLSNTGTVVIYSPNVRAVWRGDGTAGLTKVADVSAICPSINDLDEIAHLTYTPATDTTTLVRNNNGSLTPLASSSAEPYLYPPGQYVHSLSHSGSAVFMAKSGTLPGGIYIGPGAINVINVRDHPQITNYDPASMNDNLVVAFRAFNTISSKWGIYRGSAVPLIEEGGPVITNLGLVRPVINNSGTVAFSGATVSNGLGIFKTDDGASFTFVGASQDGRISINNNGAVAFHGGPNGSTIFVGSASPANRVISVGDDLRVKDDPQVLKVQSLIIWEEALNDSGQIAFRASLGACLTCPTDRIGVYRANPNRPPVAANGTASVTSGASTSGTLSATDADGDPLTYSIVANGTKGTAVITDTATGAYTYTANVGSSGTDTFAFKVNDGLDDSNTAMITVTITPEPPPCATDISATVALSRGAIKLNKKTGRYIQTVTLKNADGVAAGPVSLVLDNLSSNATLFNATGVTACAVPAGRPYININVGTDSVFNPRERATVTLEFMTSSGQPPSYTGTRVLAGAGNR